MGSPIKICVHNTCVAPLNWWADTPLPPSPLPLPPSHTCTCLCAHIQTYLSTLIYIYICWQMSAEFVLFQPMRKLTLTLTSTSTSLSILLSQQSAVAVDVASRRSRSHWCCRPLLCYIGIHTLYSTHIHIYIKYNAQTPVAVAVAVATTPTPTPIATTKRVRACVLLTAAGEPIATTTAITLF